MARSERLTAKPIKRINVDGREGWLYLWNNGDTQMFWTRPPAAPALDARRIPAGGKSLRTFRSGSPQPASRPVLT